MRFDIFIYDRIIKEKALHINLSNLINFSKKNSKQCCINVILHTNKSFDNSLLEAYSVVYLHYYESLS